MIRFAPIALPLRSLRYCFHAAFCIARIAKEAQGTQRMIGLYRKYSSLIFFEYARQMSSFIQQVLNIPIMLNRNTNSSLVVLVFVFLIFSCTKKDAGPIEISIVKITDSLKKQPISFFANVSQAPESYSWDFADGSTSTEVSPKHTYQEMGTYNVGCIVKLKGVAYSASYKLLIKGDGRILGTVRHFSGIHNYLNGSTQMQYVTRLIADTILTITAPNPFDLDVFKVRITWNHDTGSEVLYQNSVFSSSTGGYEYLRYYPANDSIYINFSSHDPPVFNADRYEFMQKK